MRLNKFNSIQFELECFKFKLFQITFISRQNVCSEHWLPQSHYYNPQCEGLTQTNTSFSLCGLTEPTFPLLFFVFCLFFCFPFFFFYPPTFTSQVLLQEMSAGWSLFSSSSSSTPPWVRGAEGHWVVRSPLNQ